MVISYSRGHKIYFKNGKWFYADNNEEYKDQRPCARCKHFPTKEGYDYCLGHIDNVISACCGHGIEKSYIIKNNMSD